MPKPPFPYTEEKIIYFNQDKSIQYGATLSLPKDIHHFPTVILISGSGQQDRDETLFGHKPFWVIADHLSRHGIAVLRVDDRGVGQSTGDVKNATSADFAQDVIVGVNYLKSRKDIDATKIGLIGHSEGGVIAPLVATQSKDIAFIISMAGLGIKGADVMKKQYLDAYRNAGLDKKELERLNSFMLMMINLSASDTDMQTLRVSFKKSMTEWMAQQPDSILVKTGMKGPNADKNINRMASRYFMPWTRYLLRYDPALVWPKIKIPVLALNGEKDTQVEAKTNLMGFDTLLKQAGNKNFRTINLPDLNHLFQTAVTGEVNEYETIEETIHPKVLTIISEWITTIFS